MLILLLSSYSLFNQYHKVSLKRIVLESDKLVGSFSIVQFSDLHLNYSKSSKRLRKTIERVNDLSPDVIVITGDVLDANLTKTDSFANILKGLKSKYGVYAVTGNHEYYVGINNFIKFSKDCNIAVLLDEFVTLNDRINIIGINDSEIQRFETSVELNKYRTLIKPNMFNILLSHRPEIFDDASQHGADLVLSGHTHAGQIPPADLILKMFFKYNYGLYKKNNSYLYLTSGTGFWGPPMRLFSSNEIIHIVIKNRKKSD
ncbi:metallophosphoesterase [Elusimicrobiota bacterium]